MSSHFTKFFFVIFLLIFAACSRNESIVHNVEEKEANEIVVYLASKGVVAQKVQIEATGAGQGPTNLYSIAVEEDKSTEAMALLNQIGLPRSTGTNLLTLFAKSGLMQSDREETIRYQAGLAEQLKNTILKIDGVLDASVELSFPPQETTPTPGAPPPKTTAAVYIKHQGILEDPNSHLETKIKRLISSSVNGLNFENVAVISDRARIADIQLTSERERISPKELQETYVSIWSIIMTKASLAKFRFIFFSLILLNLLFAGLIGWLVYRFYPQLIKRKETVEEPPKE